MNEFETLEEQKERENFLLRSRFPEECKKLPLDYLDDYEKSIVQKCINQEELNDTELKDLKQLLENYRPFLKQYDVDKVEKNLEDNIRVITSSKELLNLLDNPDRYRFDMHYKIDGQILRLQFKLKPISDSDYMDLLSVQTRVFRELDVDEKVVYSKTLNNIELSPEEEKMQQQINDKIVEIIGNVDDSNERITEFLIKHVDLVDDEDEPLTQELQERLWHKIDMGTRNLIYAKCKEILKIDENLEVELFPAIR